MPKAQRHVHAMLTMMHKYTVNTMAQHVHATRSAPATRSVLVTLSGVLLTPLVHVTLFALVKPFVLVMVIMSAPVTLKTTGIHANASIH